ncbi:MAG: hypothetical protein AAB528_01845 [Chloroflexota bacterium]
MVKVSIIFPNKAQISFESQEPEVIHEIVGMVLRDLPRELMQSPPTVDGALDQPGDVEKGSSVRRPAASHRKGPPKSVLHRVEGDDERVFVEFCRSANPLGDMRRVVVAAEGARRSLGMDSVDTADLERLFDLAGWRRPHSFVQTLRNAARGKFRWLERVPGRAGRYAATDLGRSVTLGRDAAVAPTKLTLDEVRRRVDDLDNATGDESATRVRELRDAR